MKKSYIIGIVVVIVIIVCAMFIYSNKVNNSDDDVNATESLLISENGVSIIVPADWSKASSQSNESILAVANSTSKDSNGFNDINVNIEKKDISGSLESEFNSNYKSLSYNTDYQILFTGNVSGIGGQDGMEADYTSNVDGVSKQHKAIWVEKDGSVYVILCSAPQTVFSNQEKIFNSIINTFQFA